MFPRSPSAAKPQTFLSPPPPPEKPAELPKKAKPKTYEEIRDRVLEEMKQERPAR